MQSKRLYMPTPTTQSAEDKKAAMIGKLEKGGSSSAEEEARKKQKQDVAAGTKAILSVIDKKSDISPAERVWESPPHQFIIFILISSLPLLQSGLIFGLL